MQYHYFGREARCAKCHGFVYVPEIVDANLKSLYDVIRKENGIIALETIREIPKKCGMSEKELSLRFGWDEETFSRHCEGVLPTKEHSELLKRIAQDPKSISKM